MNKILLAGLALAVPVTLASFATPIAETRAAAAQTRDIVAATNAFLTSLSADQRAKVTFPFVRQKTAVAATFAGQRGGGGGPGGRMGGGGPGGRMGGDTTGRGGRGDMGRGRMGGDSAGRGGRGDMGRGGGPGRGGGMGGFVGEKYGDAVWSNYPVSDVPRPGLALGTLTTAQHDAAMHVLQVLLSPKGYQKVLEIMGADQVLADGGEPFQAGIAAYTIGVFGTPSTTTPWMVEFGGHHLALNIVIAGARGVLTPTLTGAQPAVYTANGKTVRALAAENDKAFALLNALDDAQRKQAILNYDIGDLVLGPGHDGETIVPEGLKGSAMTARQKALLLDVASEWAGIIGDAYSKTRIEELQSGLNDTYFAWSGPITHEPGRNGSSYYRIQGPKVLIEFSPQGVGGDRTMHVHTIYRDPTNEYGTAYTIK